MPICNECGSDQAVKAGLVGRTLQRYRCKDCGHKYRDTQKIVKPTFEECCDLHLSDPIQKDNANRIIALLRDLKMKPSWYHSNSYKCHYKNKRVVYFNVYSHLFRIKVCTTHHMTGNVYDDIHSYDKFFDTQPDEMKNEFVRNLKYCKNCTTCSPGYNIEISGVKYNNVCEKGLYYSVDNPASEQIEWIIKFIQARREYIVNHAV